MSIPMDRALSGKKQTADEEREIQVRPEIQPRPIAPFPVKPFDARMIPILPYSGEPLRITIGPLDSVLHYYRRTIRYSRWAWALIRLTFGIISIIESAGDSGRKNDTTTKEQP